MNKGAVHWSQYQYITFERLLRSYLLKALFYIHFYKTKFVIYIANYCYNRKIIRETIFFLNLGMYGIPAIWIGVRDDLHRLYDFCTLENR